MSQTMPLVRVYIAAPYQLKDEALALRRRLILLGVYVTARWLLETEENSARSAQLCLDDVDDAAIVLAISPEAWANRGTGGRHVELGYAIARGKRVIVIGHRTNVFHYHAEIEVADTVDQAVALIAREVADQAHERLAERAANAVTS